MGVAGLRPQVQGPESTPGAAAQQGGVPPSPLPQPGPAPGHQAPSPAQVPQPCSEGAWPGQGLPLPPLPAPSRPCPTRRSLVTVAPSGTLEPLPARPGPHAASLARPLSRVWGEGAGEALREHGGGHSLPRPVFRSPPSVTAVCTCRHFHLWWLSFLPGQREQVAVSMGHNLAGGQGGPNT